MGQLFSSTHSTPEAHFLASKTHEFSKYAKTGQSILSEDTITLIQAYLKNGNMPKAVSVINDALKDTENATLSIAVTGETGAGKSSFINALMGVGPEEEHAARTGIVETTMERAPYRHPKFHNVTFWDLPGMGSTNFPPQTYVEQMKFFEYDFFIIISATRFKKNDLYLVEEIKKMQKNFYFVRTKVDSDLENEKKCKPKSFNKEKILQMIQDDCQHNLKRANVKATHVFLVSSMDVSAYDFQDLVTTILKELPAHKRYISMLSLPHVTEVAIDQKRKSLQQKVWLEAIKSGAVSIIPFVGIIRDYDVEKLKGKLTCYRSYFGLDDASLKKLAEDLHVPLEQLKACIQSPHLLSVENKDESLGEKLLKYTEIFCSANGGLAASGLYFRKTYYLHAYFLDVVASDAKTLLKNPELFTEKVDPPGNNNTMYLEIKERN
ncbi:interferon-gamma-inducible GTPase 10-like [Tamandua tetradactyla]|uniref:interferon-gamma-inducible GTPase 10-like n=1 Tax=Tamandua tetradactyla TaxID=48850 RepID=UPI004053E481